MARCPLAALGPGVRGNPAATRGSLQPAPPLLSGLGAGAGRTDSWCSLGAPFVCRESGIVCPGGERDLSRRLLTRTRQAERSCACRCRRHHPTLDTSLCQRAASSWETAQSGVVERAPEWSLYPGEWSGLQGAAESSPRLPARGRSGFGQRPDAELCGAAPSLVGSSGLCSVCVGVACACCLRAPLPLVLGCRAHCSVSAFGVTLLLPQITSPACLSGPPLYRSARKQATKHCTSWVHPADPYR